MQLFNVTLYQNSKFDFLRHGSTFQIENPLSCRRVWKVDLWNIYKNKILHDLCSTVTVNKHTIKDHKSYCCFGNIFIFGNGLIEYSVVLILTSLTWCSILYFLPFHYSASFNFQELFLLFRVQTPYAVLLHSVFCSYWFVILTFFFYSWHCDYSL